MRDAEFCKSVFILAVKGGLNSAQISRQLHTNVVTIQFILDKMDVQKAREEALAHIGRTLPDIAEMVMDDVLSKRDRRLGHEILTNSGVYDGARPQQQSNEGGRIVIEWDGPPPPWAPRPILDAHTAASHPAVDSTAPGEPKKGLKVSAAPNVIDAEVCPVEESDAEG
jgi:hypothetical protein